MRYEVMNITPSVKVIDVLERQMEAERQKRAEITLANAERDSTINLSQGERQEAINISEGERQKRINEATGRAREISILATATAEGTKAIADAIEKPGGEQAMNVRLVQSYIARVGQLFKRADVSIVPSELAKMQGFFEGIETVSQTVNTKPTIKTQAGS
jgi:regulator of protease activity HflC (stomatin/prohibitin superfamily)